MKRILFAIAVLVMAPVAMSASPAYAATAARNYDCSKAGNANKAVCKSAANAAAKPAARAPTARNYDCSKAGNANKAVCKAAAMPAAPTTAAKTARNYDCLKAGNANKAVCKGGATTAPAAPTSYAPRPKPAAPTVATRTPRAPASGQNTGGSSGATAKCRDGTMSFSAHRSGTCSRHGGVAQWF